MPFRNLLLTAAIVAACLVSVCVRQRTAAGSRFGEVVRLIEECHVGEVDRGELVDAAIDAAVGRLDEHSAFIRGAGRSELEAALDQRFGGVGLEISFAGADRVPTVVATVPGGPAGRVGIQPGDLLESIDGRETRGLQLKEVVDLLRGPAGAPVTIRVASAAEDTLDPAAVVRREVVVVREIVEVETVLGDRRRADGTWDWLLEDVPGVALVRITGFGERTAAEFAAAVAEISAVTGLRGVVVDLRSNPGGLLAAAVDVCDQLLDEGIVVVTRGRGDSVTTQEVRQATTGMTLDGVPLVVLVDGLTASAAEIVAAALQDHGRARICGSRTFGKGTVQSILPLSDGSGLLKLTTAEFLRPAQAAMPAAAAAAEWGVMPDEGLHVSLPAETARVVRDWRRRRDAPPPPMGGRRVATTAAPLQADPVIAKAVAAIDGPRREPAPSRDAVSQDVRPGR